MAVVGYLEGTDPLLLTRLVLRGIETLPLSNGVDQHGKNITLLTPADKVDAVVGYLHKITPVSGIALPPEYLLQACRLHKIPVFIMVPEEDNAKAKEVLASLKEGVEFVDPAKIFDRLLELLGS